MSLHLEQRKLQGIMIPFSLVAVSNVLSSNLIVEVPYDNRNRDAQEDKLTIVMMLLARAITQRYSTLTNNRLRTSSNARNILSSDKGWYRLTLQRKKLLCWEWEQMLLAMKDKSRGNLNEEENDFMLDNHYGDDSLEELNAAVILMARIQPTDEKANAEPASDGDALGEVNASIIFDDPYVENNSGTNKHDLNAHDQFVALESLIYNVQKEAKNQHSLNNELKKHKALLQKEIETCKERVKTLEKQPLKSLNYKETYEELEREIRVDKDKIDNLIKEKDKIQDEFFQLENATVKIRHETELSRKALKEKENKYLEEIVDLGEKLSSHNRIVYKMGQSIQTIHMLGKKLNKVYDPFLKAGLQSNKLIIDSPDSEDSLEDTKESQLKMKDKMIELDYEKLNALYETFVPQTKIPIEQTYLLTPSTSNVPSKSSKEMSDLPVKKMPNESKLLKLFVKLDKPIGDLQTKIDQTILEDRSIALIFDDQDVLRQFYKTRVILISTSLRRCSIKIK
ncbi:hypothetical protein Tco_0675369 [Tanacetum coccineum]